MSSAPIVAEPSSEFFRASDGYPLHITRFEPAGPPVAEVIALHGIQSHAGWYHHSSSTLAAAGYRVWFLDRRGSGRNELDRGHVRGAERFLADVREFAAQGPPAERDVQPRFLLAVSWGGKLAACLAARHPELWNGLVLLYPGLFSPYRANVLQRLGLRLAKWAGVSTKKVPVPLGDPALFTDDEEAQRWIAADSLALHEVTTGFLFAHQDLTRESTAAARRITLPTYLALAGRDRIIDNRATQKWFNRLAAVEKTVTIYPNATHTLEFEPNRDEIFADLIDWLDQRRQALAGRQVL